MKGEGPGSDGGRGVAIQKMLSVLFPSQHFAGVPLLRHVPFRLRVNGMAVSRGGTQQEQSQHKNTHTHTHTRMNAAKQIAAHQTYPNPPLFQIVLLDRRERKLVKAARHVDPPPRHSCRGVRAVCAHRGRRVPPFLLRVKVLDGVESILPVAAANHPYAALRACV